MRWLTVVGCLLWAVFLSGCETIGIEEAPPDIRLLDVKEQLEISYSDGTGRSVKINYFNDEDGYAEALAQMVYLYLKNSFGDYSLKRETVDLKIKVANNILYVDLFSSGERFGSIVYKILDYSCFDFLAKEIICPKLVGEKKTSLRGNQI